MVLEALAAVQPGESIYHEIPLKIPMVWLTGNPKTLRSLATHHRWIYFTTEGEPNLSSSITSKGLVINGSDDLGQKLQIMT